MFRDKLEQKKEYKKCKVKKKCRYRKKDRLVKDKVRFKRYRDIFSFLLIIEGLH